MQLEPRTSKAMRCSHWMPLLLLVAVPACAAQRYSPQSVAEAHAAVNAAIARGDLECRYEMYTGSLMRQRVCYFRGERDYRRARSLSYFIGGAPTAVAPEAAVRGQTTASSSSVEPE